MTNPSKWEDEGREVIGDIIGKGFVQWEKPGDLIRGTIIRKWQTKSMETPALVLELTTHCAVPVVDSTDKENPVVLSPQVGDFVNLGLGYDLGSKLGEAPPGLEIGVIYAGDVETAAHTMRRFKVFHFKQQELPF